LHCSFLHKPTFNFDSVNSDLLEQKAQGLHEQFLTNVTSWSKEIILLAFQVNPFVQAAMLVFSREGLIVNAVFCSTVVSACIFSSH
jgi:hypothetical protein